MMNINDRKVRWAQQVADLSGLDQAIIKNMFGSYDVKRASAVELVNNPDLVCVIEPEIRRSRNKEELFDCVLTIRGVK
jgi:hypothetical protein